MKCVRLCKIYSRRLYKHIIYICFKWSSYPFKGLLKWKITVIIVFSFVSNHLRILFPYDEPLTSTHGGGPLPLAVSQFRVCILRRCIWRHHNAMQRLSQFEGSSKCSPQMRHSFSSFWSYYPFAASHIPRFFARPKKMKERKNIATSLGIDRHFRGPRQHLLMQPWCALNARPSHLTMDDPAFQRSLRRTHLWRLQRPGPSKDADPELRHSSKFAKFHLHVPTVAQNGQTKHCP